MKGKKILTHSLRKDERAVSPAISTVILTSAIVTLLLVTVVFANNFLSARLAENEFNSMKQFMQTAGLQIDYVAWIIGSTQTVGYASRFGQVDFENTTLTYTVYVYKPGGYEYLANYSVGVLMFNMPANRYSMINNYYERVFPSNNSFLQEGVSTPVCHIFIVEKLPMNDGSYIRIVAAPTIRMLTSTSTADGEQNYFKFYLPILYASNETQPYRSQSVTLAGTNVQYKTTGSVNRVRVVVSFPKASSGFDNTFFQFENTIEEVIFQQSSTIQFYTGAVNVTLGLHY